MFGLLFANMDSDSDSLSDIILSQALDLLEDTLKKETYDIDIPNFDLVTDLLCDNDNGDSSGGLDLETMSGKSSVQYLEHL